MMKSATVRAKIKENLKYRVPKKVTLKTFKDTDANKNLVRYKNSTEMFKKLGTHADLFK